MSFGVDVIDAFGNNFVQLSALEGTTTAQQIVTTAASLLHTATDLLGVGDQDDIHKIEINAENNASDKAHIYVEGTLPSSDFFIRCVNPDLDPSGGNPENAQLFTVNGSGVMYSHDISTPSFLAVKSQGTSHEGLLVTHGNHITTLQTGVGDLVEDLGDAEDRVFDLEQLTQIHSGKHLLTETDVVGLTNQIAAQGTIITTMAGPGSPIKEKSNLSFVNAQLLLKASQDEFYEISQDVSTNENDLGKYAAGHPQYQNALEFTINDFQTNLGIFGTTVANLEDDVEDNTADIVSLNTTLLVNTTQIEENRSTIASNSYYTGQTIMDLTDSVDENTAQVEENRLDIGDRMTLTFMMSTLLDEMQPIHDDIAALGTSKANQSYVLSVHTIANNNQNVLTAATDQATANTLVQRDASGNANFNVLQTTGSISITGGFGSFFYQPVLENGNARTTNWPSGNSVPSTYRFGRDHVAVGDWSGVGDGLFMLDHYSEVFLRPGNENPNLSIQGVKLNPDTPFISVSDGDYYGTGEESIFSVGLDEVFCKGRVVCESIETGPHSLWLGSKLHVSENGRAQLQMRKDVIPKYLTQLSPPVVSGDLSGPISGIKLKEFISLSKSHGGSADLNVIFPQANVNDDFQTESLFNAIKIAPENASSGLEIENAAGGHPTIFLKGSNASNAHGRGLIQFSDVQESGVVSLIYSSVEDDNFHIDTTDDVMFDCTNIQLYQNTTDIVRNSVGVFAKLAELEAASSGGSSLEILSTDTTSAKLTIKNTHSAQHDSSVGLEFVMDHSGTTFDYSYLIESHAYDLVFSRTKHPSSTNQKLELLRLTGSGHVVLGGGTQENSSAWNGGHPKGTICLGRTQIISELFFSPTFHDVPASSSEAGDEGLFAVDSTGIYYRTSSEWLKAPLLDFDATIPSAPQLSVWSSVNQANTHQLANGSHRLVCSNGSQAQSAQTSRYFFPLQPAVNDTIFISALCHVELSLAPSVAGGSVYIAVIDQVWNLASKQIKLQSGVHRSCTIVYTQDFDGSKHRWVSDNGIIV